MENSDVAAERAVLSSLFKYGYEAYVEVCDLINTRTLTLDSNQVAWKCIDRIYREHKDAVLDLPTILSSAHSLSLKEFYDKKEELNHLKAIMNFPIEKESIRRLAGKIRKLEITRELRNILQKSDKSLADLNGDEPITHILGLAEGPVFDFSTLLNENKKDGPQLIFNNYEELLQYRMDNPVNQIGLSSGYPAYDEAIGGGFRKGTISLVSARMKTGKALTNSSQVYTEQGVRKIGDIKVGDKIYGPSGELVNVIGVWPQGKMKVFRVHFSDGDYVECSGNHLWAVRNFHTHKNIHLKTTEELQDKTKNKGGYKNKNYWSVDYCKPINYPKQDLVIDSYSLGLLLGDGSFCNGVTFVNSDPEIIEHLKQNFSCTIRQDKVSIISTRVGISGLLPAIRNLGLFKKNSFTKFIPKQYLYSSIEDRVAMLQGLMDTDGSVRICPSTKVNYTYTTASLQLAKDFKILVNSLGGWCSIKEIIRNFHNKNSNNTYYECSLRFKDNINTIFRLKKKRDKCQINSRRFIKYILKIEELDEYKEMTCISVDSTDGMFLTNNYTPTHNSSHAANVSLNNILQSVPVLFCDSEMAAEEVMPRITACMSGVSITEIERGTFGKDPTKRKKVMEAAAMLKDMPYHHLSICGQPFEDTIAAMRRWLHKVVGFDANGNHNPCLIILDYLKVQTGENMRGDMKEYQLLGFMTTSLVNFAQKYQVPILAYAQVNRDGITSEETDVIAGSDRIGWFASNGFLLKRQSNDEIVAQQGNRTIYNSKLVHLFSRHGPGLDESDYINYNFNRNICKFSEGPLKSTLETTVAGQKSTIGDNDGPAF